MAKTRERKDSGYMSHSEMPDQKKSQLQKQKEKPLNELLTHSIVDIYVGPSSTHWPLHEKLLCHHSAFFRSIFYSKSSSSSSSKSYGLPDSDDPPFQMLVSWLYSRVLPPPKEEKHIGPLLDLYLLADKFEMEILAQDVVDAVREYYHDTATYPGLRRVQYIYANTEDDNVMREMMMGSIARYLALGEKIPMHWAKALRRDGQLALDVIRSVQEWHLEEKVVPDPRDKNADGGRLGNGAFSAVEAPEKDEQGEQEGQGEKEEEQEGGEAEGRETDSEETATGGETEQTAQEGQETTEATSAEEEDEGHKKEEDIKNEE